MDMSAASASRIKTNKQCEMKYFIEYHLKIPETRKGNIYTHKGSAVHEVLEQWVNAVLGKEENAEIDYVKTLRDYYVEHRLWLLDDRKPERGDPYPQAKNCELCPHMTKGGECSILSVPVGIVDGCPRVNYDDDLALVEGAIKSKDCQVLNRNKDGDFKKKILGVELKFDGEIDGIPLRAFLDLAVEEDADTIEVVDYKTGGRAMSYAAAYKDPQVRLYGKIISQLYPQYKYVLVTLWFLRKGPVTVPITTEMNELTVKSLKNNWNQITRNVNPLRIKSWLCNYCIGWEACGKIRNKFTVDRQFSLPIISCRMEGDENPCHGGLRVENPDAVRINSVDKMTYACRGHNEIHRGGEYTPEIPVQTDE